MMKSEIHGIELVVRMVS
jgi:hypothetical protein